jgi:PAS domain S-box-containing protein
VLADPLHTEALAAAFAGSPLAMFVLDDSTVVRQANAAAAQLLGRTREQLEGAPLLRFVGDGDTIPDLHSYAPQVWRVRRGDGTVAAIELVGVPAAFGGTQGLLVLGRDMTERRPEAQLAVNERLAALGTLAAGVAHEINNPLAYLLANLELLEQQVSLELGPGDEQIVMIRECREGASRIAEIVRRLQGLSQTDVGRPVPLEPRQVVERAIRLSHNELRHSARVVTTFGATPLVEADEGRLVYVLVNLLVNAAQAIPPGHVEDNEIVVTTSEDSEGRAVIEVRDTGCGILPEHLGRIFDPFFTLKAVGTGPGLGLTISHRTVTELGGTITVQSTPGKGTRFRVVLPGLRVETTGRRAVVPETGAQRRGRVLIVDDEPTIRTALVRTLRSEHDVVLASSGREALELLRAGERFDVILCDLMMPDLTGMDVHAGATEIASDQAERMVFVTGGAFTDDALAFLERVKNARMDKPFHPRDLRALVQRMVMSLAPAGRPRGAREG